MKKKPAKFKKKLLNGFENFRNTTLVNAVEKVVEFRYAFLGGVLALLFISVATLAGGLLKFQPFPELDGDIAEARIILPPGSSLSQTEAVVEKIVASAQKLDKEWTQNVEKRCTTY